MKEEVATTIHSNNINIYKLVRIYFLLKIIKLFQIDLKYLFVQIELNFLQ